MGHGGKKDYCRNEMKYYALRGFISCRKWTELSVVADI